MEQDIQIFNNPEFGEIRTIKKDDEPMFCLADVCKALDIQNSSRVANEILDDDLRFAYPIRDSLGREQNAIFTNESGLYTIILRSNKPEAKQFRKWVTSEVLPTIRKNGMYATEELLDNPDLLIAAATKLKEEQRARKLAEQRATDNNIMLSIIERIEERNRHIESMMQELYNDYVQKKIASIEAELLNFANLLRKERSSFLKQIREESNLTQSDLANLTLESIETIDDIENNRCDIEFNLLVRLLGAMNYTVYITKKDDKF